MNGWLLLAMFIDEPGPRWSEAMSDALDLAIVSARKLEGQNVVQKPDGGRWRGEARTIDGPYCPPRGTASAEELMRRNAAAVVMGRAPIPTTIKPGIKVTKTGKFKASVSVNGRRVCRTFPTSRQAEEWASEMKEGA